MVGVGTKVKAQGRLVSQSASRTDRAVREEAILTTVAVRKEERGVETIMTIPRTMTR